MYPISEKIPENKQENSNKIGIFVDIGKENLQTKHLRGDFVRVLLGFLLFVGAGGIVAYVHYDLETWMKPPEVRMSEKWMEHIVQIEKRSPKVKTAMLLLKKWNLKSTEPYFVDLLNKATPPFRKAQKGVYRLDVQVMPWIEDMKYGFMMQHELFDSKNNKVNEFNIEFEVGRLW